MQILVMPAQISTLSEGLVAELALVRSLARVLAEVVSQVAAFTED